MTVGSDIVDSLTAENRLLRREARELEARVRALEASRWHRLNPRRLLRQVNEVATDAVRPASSLERDLWSTAPDADVDPRVARFAAEVAAAGTFTRDTVVDRVSYWEPFLSRQEGRGARILEIGSYEGLSACYFLWRLPDASLTCVDTFDGRPGIEAIFDANVALVDASRVRKVVGDSRRVLLDLVAEGAQADIVYVDGSHLGLDVIVDAALSWQLLAPGGTLVFDDYAFDHNGRDALLRPGLAIDAFLTLVEGKYTPVFKGHQLAVAKWAPEADVDIAATDAS